jgi:hypothetical protein
MRSCISLPDHHLKLRDAIFNFSSVSVFVQNSLAREHITKPVYNICRISWKFSIKANIISGLPENPAMSSNSTHHQVSLAGAGTLASAQVCVWHLSPYLSAVVARLWRWFVLTCSGLEDLRDGASLRRLFGSVFCHPAAPIGWRAAALPLPWSRGWQIQLPHPQVVRPRWCGGLSASRSCLPRGNRGRRPTGTWSRPTLFPGVSFAIFRASL